MSLRRNIFSRRALQTVEKRFCQCYTNDGAKHTKKLTNSDIRLKRIKLFEKEKNRQTSTLKRIEKIEVKYRGQFEPCTLVMNRFLSTPYHCAMHINELTMERSVLALVNGEPWDMHQPLVDDCEIQFLHFLQDDQDLVNEAFWKSCSFLLGYIMERAFKDEYTVHNCTFPRPFINSGSFTYDVDLNKLPETWSPTETELRTMSRIINHLQKSEARFQRLDVEVPVARQMFEDNYYKTGQIPAIAENSKSGFTIPVYRIYDHVDISNGPLIPSASFVNFFKITALHKIQHKKYGCLTRVQGMALPRDLRLHYFAFEALCQRAKNLNTSWEDLEEHFLKHKREKAKLKAAVSKSQAKQEGKKSKKDDLQHENHTEEKNVSWAFS